MQYQNTLGSCLEELFSVSVITDSCRQNFPLSAGVFLGGKRANSLVCLSLLCPSAVFPSVSEMQMIEQL